MYDFDTPCLRINKGSSKWDTAIDQGCPEGITPFSVADMEFKSAPEIIEALKETAEYGMWGYTYGDDSYKDAVVHWMKKRHQWTIEEDWIVTSAGVVPAIFNAVRAFTKPGDSIIVQSPVYYPFYSAINKNGRNILESPLKSVNGRYEMDFDDLSEKAKHASMMILCSPHNPVGRVWTKEELETLAEICYKNNVLVFADEIHFDLVYKPAEQIPYGALPEKYSRHCIISTAASKTFSLAGLSCSNIIISDPELREQFATEQEKTGSHFNSTFGTVATKTAYLKGEPWLDELLDYIYGNYKYFKAFMAENFKDVNVFDLQGTYLVWFDCRCFGLSTEELEKFMKESANLYLDEGYIFGTGGAGFERFNIACPRSVLQEALERLKKAALKRGLI